MINRFDSAQQGATQQGATEDATVDPAAEEAVALALAVLAAPGSFFSGSERLDLAAQARFARGLQAEAPTLDPMLADSASRIATDAIDTRPRHIDAWEADGRDVLAYLELVAVVSLIASIDSYRIGIGASLDALPVPTAGEPVSAVDDRAQKTNAWVPTVGIALAPTALSALPNEKANKDALSAIWYLTDKLVHSYDVDPGRELTRPQMELVASRTSWLNECFF